jgi:hypothetical protein
MEFGFHCKLIEMNTFFCTLINVHINNFNLIFLLILNYVELKI